MFSQVHAEVKPTLCASPRLTRARAEGARARAGLVAPELYGVVLVRRSPRDLHPHEPIRIQERCAADRPVAFARGLAAETH